ncbi:DEKNAAC102292 [Brettanomyces naardenensis]|uniref:DEKNAAC102292 n=1 Tax=Brettanomyces naardenensis TaxID=13370 RepID=A0A448YKR5_BRENA|nr:DEKNAAC102292 [Brettanomyces naardenensis]
MSLNLPKVSGLLSGISPLVMGGAVFNTQYNDDPASLAIKELLLTGLKKGINAIDTSPYYGPSEELIGIALRQLVDVEKVVTRDNYYICTKVGRIRLDEFDYSPEWVRKSIARSLKRLNTSYLDVVYLHDIEFVQTDKIYAALKTMMELKAQGFIRNVGISGYPVDFLYKIACSVKHIPEIGPLDLVLSYSNMCLQNTTLLDYYDRFIKDTGIKLLNNASILSMSLLRSQETRPFHPASKDLKERCNELAKLLQEKYDVELAELATRFAFRIWLPKQGRTVLGVSTIPELESACDQYQTVLSKKLDSQDAKLDEISQKFLGDYLNETWASGISH